MLEEIIPRDSFFNDFEITHELPGLGERAMLLNARRLDNPEGGPERILLGIEDVTERKEAELARPGWRPSSSRRTTPSSP